MKDFHIQWHITNNCNLRCLHCYQDNFSTNKELGWPELKRVADNVISTIEKWEANLTVSLTGGEPFLKKELFELINYFSSWSSVSSVNIITNATLIDRFMKPLIEVKEKIDKIYFSLEGITPETNDYIRGEGVFERVLKNIETLKKEGFELLLMFTLLRRNLEEAKDLIDFSRALGIKGFILERFIPLGQSQRIKDTQLISPFQLRRVYREIFSNVGVDFFEEAVKFHALKVEFEDKKASLFGAECIVGKYGCAIMPQGEVLPCRRFYLEVGNLLKKPLLEIWSNSQVLHILRDKRNLKGVCLECEVEGCRGCRALAYALGGDYLSSDPLCWLTLDEGRLL